MSKYYRLDGKDTVPCEMMEWAMRFEGERHVALDEIAGVRVSTVFLGLDHQFGNGPPLLFETMVFGDHPMNEEQERYSTWDEAEAGHRAICERVRKALQ